MTISKAKQRQIAAQQKKIQTAVNKRNKRFDTLNKKAAEFLKINKFDVAKDSIQRAINVFSTASDKTDKHLKANAILGYLGALSSRAHNTDSDLSCYIPNNFSIENEIDPYLEFLRETDVKYSAFFLDAIAALITTKHPVTDVPVPLQARLGKAILDKYNGKPASTKEGMQLKSIREFLTRRIQVNKQPTVSYKTVVKNAAPSDAAAIVSNYGSITVPKFNAAKKANDFKEALAIISEAVEKLSSINEDSELFYNAQMYIYRAQLYKVACLKKLNPGNTSPQFFDQLIEEQIKAINFMSKVIQLADTNNELKDFIEHSNQAIKFCSKLSTYVEKCSTAGLKAINNQIKTLSNMLRNKRTVEDLNDLVILRDQVNKRLSPQSDTQKLELMKNAIILTKLGDKFLDQEQANYQEAYDRYKSAYQMVDFYQNESNIPYDALILVGDLLFNISECMINIDHTLDFNLSETLGSSASLRHSAYEQSKTDENLFKFIQISIQIMIHAQDKIPNMQTMLFKLFNVDTSNKSETIKSSHATFKGLFHAVTEYS